MEITFLGTGAGIPSKERNVTAIYLNLLQEIKTAWLFDCGEATQHQILHTTIKPRKISKIFITHLHGDHIFGLPGFLSSRSFLGGTEPVTIYGPKGIRDFVEASLGVSETHLAYQLHFVNLEPGVLFSDEYATVECVLLNHNIVSYGFKITEKDKIGELNVRKLMENGIKPGPVYREIKENIQVTTENGTVLLQKDFLGEPKKGKVITLFGDTKYMPEHVDFIREADCLVHEATFDADKEQLAIDYGHTTTAQAAALAKSANVGKLILTHFSSRYQESDQVQLLAEAQEIFPKTFLANDFATFEL